MQPASVNDVKKRNTNGLTADDGKQKEEDIKTFIFFDFECTQDDLLHCNMGYEPSTEDRKCKNCKQSWCGTKQHIPNLCVAHKVCEKCMDENVNKSSRCDVCGQNENVFVGDTARDDFCRWLFSEYNAGAKVLCHNFKSYDSYPILQYLYKHAILPEVIMTGVKVHVHRCPAM